MKFLVDLPLGGLAKWLRFCGFDTTTRRLTRADSRTMPPPRADTVILTRQEAFRRLARPDLLIIRTATPEDQLAEVLGRLKISRDRLDLLSRCSRCNALLTPVSREQVQGLVPEHVFHYQDNFYECPRCRRIFWPGSHLPGIVKKVLDKLAESQEGADAPG